MSGGRTDLKPIPPRRKSYARRELPQRLHFCEPVFSLVPRCHGGSYVSLLIRRRRPTPSHDLVTEPGFNLVFGNHCPSLDLGVVMLGMIASFLTRNDAAQNPGPSSYTAPSGAPQQDQHVPISSIA